MIKEIKGVPVFDISKRIYIGQYLKHEVSFVDGKEVWNMYLGEYSLFVETKNKKLLPLFMNGVYTKYFELFLNGIIKPKMFYEHEKFIQKVGISSKNILNLDYVMNGEDNVLFVDLNNVIEDIEFIRKLDNYAVLKDITEQHKIKIKALRETAEDYKRLYEIEKKEKELIETKLERYRFFYENIRLTIVEMEVEMDKLKTIIERLTTQIKVEREERERIEALFHTINEYAQKIKKLEKDIEKEGEKQ